MDDINPLRQFKLSMDNEAATLYQPSDAIRGVYLPTIQYHLSRQADSVSIEILDTEGEVLGTYIGTTPEYKPDPNVPWWQRGGSSVPTTANGLNKFTWDSRYSGAATFDGMIIWSGRPTRGPKAPIGEYTVRLKVGGKTLSKSFKLEMNPNLKGVTEADLKEQFDLAISIRNSTSEANKAVIKIRKIKSELTDADKLESSQGFINKLTAIEEDLYQTKNRSGQDPLNFPIRLNNRLASLRRSVETGDAKPTDGAYKVYDELRKELEGHLAKLDQLIENEMPK
jgi:hypothetical protein